MPARKSWDHGLQRSKQRVSWFEGKRVYSSSRKSLHRGYYGTYHQTRSKHLPRYVDKFAGRHKIHEEDTVDQMALIAKGFVGKRLRYRDLVA